jgi:hypothetical protein
LRAASGDNTFCGLGGVFFSFALAVPASISPSAEAAKRTTERRDGDVG